MILRTKLKEPYNLIRVAMFFLAASLISMRFIHPATDFWSGFADGFSGMLFGIGAGCLILVTWMLGQRRNGTAG